MVMVAVTVGRRGGDGSLGGGDGSLRERELARVSKRNPISLLGRLKYY